MKNNKKLDPVFAETVRWGLEEIRKQQYATPTDGDVYFSCIKPKTGPTTDDQRRAIHYLEQQGALKIKKEKFPMNMMAIAADMFDFEPQGFYLDIIEPRFERLLNGNQTHPYFDGVDVKRGVLRLEGKDIEISKGGKETYSMQLLSTLQKDPGHEWFKDEILTDWGYSEDEQGRLARNRVYNAARKVNELIDKTARIPDFIQFNTAKFWINPKYLKDS